MKLGKKRAQGIFHVTRVLTLVFGAYTVAFGGCISDQQIRDFASVQIARWPADIAGQIVLTLLQGILPS
jgi:hypothetical protein